MRDSFGILRTRGPGRCRRTGPPWNPPRFDALGRDCAGCPEQQSDRDDLGASSGSKAPLICALNCDPE